jgi:hypothetical protein
MKSKTQINLIITCSIGLLAGSVQAAEWKSLIDGSSLAGWEQVGGDARYEVQGDEIVGLTVADTPNSFLVTKKKYTDFILEYETRLGAPTNSGMQFRSNIGDKGIVEGYQVEVDPTDRRFSGGLYDEKRRKWLYPLTRNEKGRDAFRNGDWNHFRVEAVGNSIRVWVNGIQTVDMVDDMTAKGFLGLQVHSIKNPEHAGISVHWRNIRILTEDLAANRMPRDPEITEISYLHNQLTDREVRQGWRLLWDGKSTEGWRGAKLDHFPPEGWNIKDGVLSVQGTDGRESAAYGDIVTLDTFTNFELQFEFLLTEGANSGIKYFVDADLNLGPGSAIGCEFQLLDDAKHPDAKEGVSGNRTLASLYDMLTAENLQTEGRSKQFKGIGSWNHGRIVSHNGRVEHWLNNEKVVEFDRFSQMFEGLTAYSKYQKWDGFCQWPEGRNDTGKFNRSPASQPAAGSRLRYFIGSA